MPHILKLNAQLIIAVLLLLPQFAQAADGGDTQDMTNTYLFAVCIGLAYVGSVMFKRRKASEASNEAASSNPAKEAV